MIENISINIVAWRNMIVFLYCCLRPIGLKRVTYFKMYINSEFTITHDFSLIIKGYIIRDGTIFYSHVNLVIILPPITIVISNPNVRFKVTFWEDCGKYTLTHHIYIYMI